MKPFIWPWSCHRSCLNSAPDLDYRFGEIEMTLSWFSCNGFARSTTLYLFISPWFIFLGFIDNYFIGPAWCVTPIGPFICNGTSLRYLTLKRLGFRQGRGIASADFFRETLKQKKKWSSFSIIIRINKGEDYEFLAVAVRDIWQRNYSQ